MPSLTIDAARDMLRSREHLLATGQTDRTLQKHVASGRLVRVRRGFYVRGKDWNPLWAEDKHLVQVIAAHFAADVRGIVAVGESAAVIHRLPLFRTTPTHVHALIEGERHSRARAGIRWHDIAVAPDEIAEVDGIRCTDLTRTVLDIASSLSREAALAATDAALRRYGGDRRALDLDAVEDFRAQLAHRAQERSTPGIRQARKAIELGDARSDSAGESVSRLQIIRLGFTRFDLQRHVRGPDGEDYWLDFAFEHCRRFGEFDGLGKYTDAAMLGKLTPQEAVIAEKKREDDVRGVTGWGFGRWGSEHIVTAKKLGARLSAFGITPP